VRPIASLDVSEKRTISFTCWELNNDTNGCSILIKPSNTTKYVSLSLLLIRTTCFGPLSDHHQVFKS